MNVIPVWKKGYTGKGIVVTILDDGIEKNHPDLKRNYDPQASYDINNDDPDPQPRYDFSNENRHGTRCAGEVAAQADNHICGVGIAYDASIGGVRMLDGDVTDAVEAHSLSLHPQHIDIYSASWGPDDDGRTVDGPATMAKKAFYDGVAKGRGGLGSIFVWASGNGGRDGDNCNCDGYTNSIYTLSISSATEDGHVPWYSEACSSTLATTYSSGASGEKQVITTDLRKSCTDTHTGTSASAPMAAGICALTLQANPRLTWRDMQHIVVMTARPEGLKSTDWITNGVGRKVSHSFGYGVMDAAAMVDMAKNWTNVPTQHRCLIHYKGAAKNIPPNHRARVALTTDGCRGNSNHVLFLEHVQAIISLTGSRRGELQIFLVSPQGTRSSLLARRSRDSSSEGFNNWAFMTTHNWGELSVGTWNLEIVTAATSSTLKTWSLMMYGTASDPHNGYHLTKQKKYQGCKSGDYILNGGCFPECPNGYFASNVTVKGLDPLLPATANETDDGVTLMQECVPCYHTCETCFGASPNECLTCMLDSHLVNNSCIENATIELPLPVQKAIMRTGHLTTWVAGISCVVVAVMIVFAIISYAVYWCRSNRQGPGYNVLAGEDPTEGPAIIRTRNLNLNRLPKTPLGNSNNHHQVLLDDSSSDSEL
ncbi:hypothetical protein NP493_427g01043 [Ridgeia piscesae]|uniref:P/Homo B domain-containing protein n=1 Tax=Ridgeia piscesae TaxID=27915 RepID=A0AAD9NU35_RIDPI|nr:hypothetical protein NP493_427g01043 [Ridgeia piscesae]